jgi:Tol biopolymer transport system component
MREFDDAALELRLRGVLREHLGALPLDITGEDLERRREIRDTARRRRRGLVALGLAAALLVPLGVLVGGGRPRFEAFVVPAPSASPDASATPEASTGVPSAQPSDPAPSQTPAATPGAPTVADPHALLVLTSKAVYDEGAPSCVNVDRHGTRDGSSRRLVTCGDRVMVTRDGTTAAVGGPRGMSIVDLRDGHELGTIDTGRRTFPTAWSPRGRWLVWSSCRSAQSASCSVILSARDGSGQHELYRGDDGYASSVTWLPDESRVAVPTGGSEADILAGAADGSDLRPLAPGGPDSGWAGGIGMDNRVIDRAPDARGYLYLDTQIPADCNGQSVTGCQPVLADVMSQGLSQGANDGPPVNLTNLAPGQFAVAATWSPDGRTLAFLRKTIDPAVDPYEFQGTLLRAPAELWLRDASGTIRRIEGVALPEPQDGAVEPWVGRIHWSPDGTHLAIEAGNGRSGTKTSIDTYLVAVDGSTQAVLRDARSVAWSPDGTELAFLHWTGPTALGDNETVAPATIEVADADGTDRRQVSTPPGNPDGLQVLWATN